MSYNIKLITAEAWDQNGRVTCEGVRCGDDVSIEEINKLIQNPGVLKISIVNTERRGINGKPKKA